MSENFVSDAVGALAMAFLDRTLKSSKSVTIPSLGIVIEGDDVSDNYITEAQLQTIERMMMRHTWQDVTTLKNEELAAMIGAIRGLRTLLTAMTARAEAAEAKLLALQVDRSKTVKLRDDTDNVIWTLKPADVPGAINWGDLGVREVQEVIDEERCWWRVVIEEADPSNPALHAAVLAGLEALGWDTDDIELETEW